MRINNSTIELVLCVNYTWNKGYVFILLLITNFRNIKQSSLKEKKPICT